MPGPIFAGTFERANIADIYPGFPVTMFGAEVATIAALRALTLTCSSAFLNVLNYAVLGDKGGGPFYVDTADTTSADNDGTIIVDAVGRRWYRYISGNVMTPEMFGAIGDGVTDDYPAFAACFSPTVFFGKSNHQLKIQFRPNTEYYLSQQLNILTQTSASAKFGGFLIDGQGSQILSNALVAIQIGNFSTATKLFFSRIQDLTVSRKGTSADAGSACILADYVDFLHLENVQLGGAANGFSSGAGSLNYLRLDGCSIAGNVNGIALTLGDNNVFSIRGGKIQQNTNGIVIFGGAIGLIEQVDLSLNTGNIINLSACAGIEIVCVYSESEGGATVGNQDSVIAMAGCNLIKVHSSTIAAAGSGNTNNIAFGISLVGCTNIDISGNSFERPQIADVIYDVTSSNIRVDRTNNVIDLPSAIDLQQVRVIANATTPTNPTPPTPPTNQFALTSNAFNQGEPLVETYRYNEESQLTPRGFIRLSKMQSAENQIISSCDFTDASWAPFNSPAQAGTMTAPDGVGTAQIWTFPNIATSGWTTTITPPNAPGGSIAGQSYIFRIWAYLTANNGASGIFPAFNIRLNDTHNTVNISSVYTLAGCWRLLECNATVPVGSTTATTITVLLENLTNFGPFNAALWGAQFIAGRTDNCGYYPKPDRNGSLVVSNSPYVRPGLVLPAPVILQYGPKTVRMITAEASPSSLSLAPPYGDTIWHVGDMCFNSAPAVGSPYAWFCTTAGTPGTWSPTANL